MVIEVATLFVKNEAEADFVRDFTKGADILRRQPGCRNLRWGKRVEPELAYYDLPGSQPGSAADPTKRRSLTGPCAVLWRDAMSALVDQRTRPANG